jgi:hypothetical protein
MCEVAGGGRAATIHERASSEVCRCRRLVVGEGFAQRAVARSGLKRDPVAEYRARRSSEIAASRRGQDIGVKLIDTAEMQADKDTELPIGEAIASRRDEAFLVSAAPRDRDGTVQAPATKACAGRRPVRVPRR